MTDTTTFDIDGILKRLPHRYPFLMVDRVLEVVPGKSIVAVKNVSANEAYFEGHPYLTGELAEWLADAGAALVGIDSYNIDDTEDGSRPVHTVLLGREIPIVEHLRGLHAVPERGSRFFGVPVKVRGFGTFPVRAFVIA